MKRRSFLKKLESMGAAAMTFYGCSGTGSGKSTRHLVATPQKRADYCTGLLQRICGLGPHPSGTPEYDKAAEIVKAELDAALPVALYDRYTFEKCEVVGDSVFRIGDRTIETYIAQGCSGTPESGIRGIVWKTDSGGSYIVVDEFGSNDATITVSEFGRAVPRFVGSSNIRCLPRFNIGKQDTETLDSAVANKTPVFLNAQVRFVPDTQSRNVIGVQKGKSADELMFLAHLDTVYSSPGANDNTASLITMLMLAQAVSGTKPDLTVTFAATGSEEYGLLGAYHYAKRREEEGTLSSIRYIVNFDSLTYGPNLQVYTNDEHLRSLVTAIHNTLKINGTPKFFDSDGYQLDALPFKASGAKAMYFNSRGYDEETLHLWHRPEDLPETVHLDCVESSFLVCRELITRLHI